MEFENGRDEDSFADYFLEITCQFRPLFGPLLAMEAVFVLLILVAFPFNPPGSAGRVILYLILPLNMFVLVSTAGLIHLCGLRR